MNKLKSGFSLAEVLIALAIVSVIATIGFTVTKRGIDRAYDLYVYTGYQGLTDAIAYANESGKSITNNRTEFEQTVSDVLNGSIYSADNTYIETANKTLYKFTYLGATETEPIRNYFYITMKVPSRKKVVNNVAVTQDTICLLYAPDDEYGILIPINEKGTCKASIENVANRIDLLPFYVDNGIVGRVTPNPDGGRTYKPRTYYSAQDALCAAFNRDITDSTGAVIGCPNQTNERTGSVRTVNPRKIR